MTQRPPPHLAVRAVRDEPLEVAFKVAFDQRMAELARERGFGRLRSSVVELSVGRVPQLRERLAALGFDDVRLYAVPYVPPETGERHLALVACRPDAPARGVFMMRRAHRWAPRPYLERVLARLDPEGRFLRHEGP